MSKNAAFQEPLALAVAENATTPVPSAPGVEIWSTTASKKLMWDGAKWAAVGGASSSGGGATTALTPQTQAPASVSTTPDLYVQRLAGRDFLALRSNPLGVVADAGGTPQFHERAGWSAIAKRSWVGLATGSAASPTLYGWQYPETFGGVSNGGPYEVQYGTAAVAGSSAGTRGGGNCQIYGASSYTYPTEFFYTTRFRPQANWPTRLFVGLTPQAAAWANADPSTNPDLYGIGKDAADTLPSFMTRMGTGTVVKTAIPGLPTASTYAFFDLAVWCPRMPLGQMVLYLSLRWGTEALPTKMGAWAHHTLSLGSHQVHTTAPNVWINNGVNAATQRINLNSQYIEIM